MKRFTNLKMLWASLAAVAMVLVGLPASADSAAPPVVEAQTLETVEDTSVSGTVVVNPDDAQLSYGEASDGVIVSDGADFTYIPNPGSLGTDEFVVTATDSNGLVGSNTMTIHVFTEGPLPLLFDGDMMFDVGCDSLTVHHPVLRGDYREQDPFEYWLKTDEPDEVAIRFDAPIEEGGMGAELGVPFPLEIDGYKLELDVHAAGEYPPVRHETVDGAHFTIDGCDEEPPPVNNPPTLKDKIVAVNLDDGLSTFELEGADKDEDPLEYTITDNPNNGVVKKVEDNQFSFDPTSRGEASVGASVSDGQASVTSQVTFQVTETVVAQSPSFDPDTGILTVPSQDGVYYHINGGDPWIPGDPYPVCGTATVEARGVQWVELSGTTNWTYSYDCDDEPEPPAIVVNRWEGTDRYGTAAEFARNGNFSNGVTVYVATGVKTPDALAAAGLSVSIDSGVPVMANGAPILLVKPDHLPDVTAGALSELKPSRIVVVGSETAVSTTVERQLGKYAPVERLGGANRYETAVKVALESGYDYDVIYMASGHDDAFADALSAGPLSRSTGGAILLAKQDLLPGVTGDALGQLQPARLVIVGGPDRVSDKVAQAAAEAAGLEGFERVAGANRYETSYLVAKEFSEALPTRSVYVATGPKFPDALTAGAQAGTEHAPVLLVRPEGNLPQGFAGAFDWRRPEERIVIAGGEDAVSADVERQLEELVATP